LPEPRLLFLVNRDPLSDPAIVGSCFERLLSDGFRVRLILRSRFGTRDHGCPPCIDDASLWLSSLTLCRRAIALLHSNVRHQPKGYFAGNRLKAFDLAKDLVPRLSLDRIDDPTHHAQLPPSMFVKLSLQCPGGGN